MFCDRCGVRNPEGRTTCLHCMGALKESGDPGAMCAEHPSEPATGRCVTCQKYVCEACGGVVSNRGVFCIDHTPAVTTSASASPGMNPLLSGGGADAPIAAARGRTGVDSGMIAAIAGIVAILVFFGIAFGFPAPLRSKELPAPPPPAAGVGGAGGYGPGGYGPGGGATDSYGGYPGGPMGPGYGPGAMPGGSAGPPGGPPGGPSYGPPGGPSGPSGSSRD
jgi:B-box zinc finger protein